MSAGAAASSARDYGEVAAELLGREPVLRGEEALFHCPLPCCAEHEDRKLYVQVRTGAWHCFRGGLGGAFGTLAERLGQSGWTAPPDLKAAPTATRRLASPEARDLAYRVLLSRLPLHSRHRDQMRARGFTDPEVEAAGYRSFPAVAGRVDLIGGLVDELGDEALRDVPGFFRAHRPDGGERWTLAGEPGIAIPVRDEQGRVLGIRLRPDRQKPDRKYVWLSSAGHHRGTSAPAELHFAWPIGRPDDSLRTCYVTEGELKAHAITSRLGVLAVSVPGVSLWRSTDLPHRLKALGITAIVLANDADATSKPPVAKATNAVAEALLVQGIAVSVAVWDAGMAKGLDDLILLRDGRPELVNLRDWRNGLPEAIRAHLPRPRGATDIPAAEMPAPEPPVAVVTLAEGRRRLAADLRRLVREPARGRAEVLVAPPGVGKTHAALEALAELRASGRWPTLWQSAPLPHHDGEVREKLPMRAAVLFPTREAVQEAWDGHPGLHSFAVVQEGRSPDPESGWYCQNFELAQAFGRKRHSPRLKVCEECPFQEQCKAGGYLAALKEARQADLVLAVHQVFLGAADELGGAAHQPEEPDGTPKDVPPVLTRRPVTLAVVDEDFLPQLVEPVAITPGVLSEWAGAEAAPGRSPQGAGAAARLHQLIAGMLARAVGDPAHEPAPALPLLRQEAERANVDLARLVWQLRGEHKRVVKGARVAGGKGGYTSWDCEEHFRDGGPEAGRLVIPLRLHDDLLHILAEETQARRQSERETRLWLSREPDGQGRAQPALLLQVTRRRVVQRLRAATLIHLDATPNRDLFTLVFPNSLFGEINVGAAVTTTQVDNALYTAQYLRAVDGGALGTVQSAIDGIAARHPRVAVFCPKEFDPEADARPGFRAPQGRDVLFGHFGGSTRALNRYAGRDAIVVAGHFQVPPFEAEALVQALRWCSVDRKVELHPAASARRAYHWRRPDGSGRGRIVHGHADPLVQATLEHTTEAEIVQAIGRARAVNRPPDQPVHVYLLTAAVTTLPVDRLLSTDELLADLGVRSARPARSTEPLAGANTARQAEAEQRIRRAVEDLRAAGKPATVAAVARAAGCSRNTAARFLETLGAVGLEPKVGGAQAECNIDPIAPGLSTPHLRPDPLGEKASAASAPAAAEAGTRLRVAASGPEAELVADADRFRQVLAETEAAPLVGLDTETTGLDPHGDRLRTLQIAAPSSVYVVDVQVVGDLTPVRDWLAARARAGRRTALHNGQFDLRFLRAATGGAPLDPVTVEDTMLRSQVLACGLPVDGGHSLAAVSARWLGLELPKQERHGDWTGPLTPEQVAYAGRDAWATARVAERLRPRLEAEGLARVAALEDACAVVTADMAYAGVAVDAEALGALAAVLQSEAAEAEAQAAGLMGSVREGTTGRRSQVGGFDINLRSQPQVLAALRALGLGIDSTKEEVLRPLASQHPAVGALLAYRRGEHLGRLAEGLSGVLHPDTGRIHADWHQLVRNGTGRFSCSSPSLQNVPHDPRFRRAFTAPEGRALVIADLSQIELRIMAKLSGDPRMMVAFRDGQDLHRLTASLLAGVPPEAVTKEQRQLAKACNFGLIYGMSARGLQAYASSSYGVAMDYKQAREFRRRFFAAYPGVAAYHERQHGRARAEREARTLLGRCRRWETNAMPLPELLNAPCQGSGADILKAAMGALRPVLLRTGSDLVLAVHDELVVECPAGCAEEVRQAVRDALVRAGSDLLQPVPVDAEAVIGATWADKG